ncbi:MAG: hypothetical protein DRJ10_01295 [Bacteroidetes bacterium]|nr:MAG: hypothetical protein DRJ10_01295 [Bacteroidota bacterium]
MSKYKVLWFDDEHEELEIIKDDALLNEIELVGVNNAMDGLEKLDSQPFMYDAVILDGLFFLDNSNTGDAVNQAAFGKVAKKLRSLKDTGTVIPWFIFSGQPSFVKETHILVDVLSDKDFSNGKVFDKSKDEDFEELCKEIIKASNEITTTRIKHKYFKAFKVFDNDIIDIKYRQILIEILACLEMNDYKKKNLNTIRDLLEAIFLTLTYEYECIPESFINNRGNPNHQWCSLFFAGVNVDLRDGSGKTFKIPFKIPSNISSSITYIKEMSNGFSHINDHDIVKNAYISSTYSILEVLEWLPGFIDENFE